MTGKYDELFQYFDIKSFLSSFKVKTLVKSSKKDPVNKFSGELPSSGPLQKIPTNTNGPSIELQN